MTPRRARRLAPILALMLPALASVPLGAQDLEDPRGTLAAGLLLRQLDGVKRVLVVGAHPDDEDTSLLTALARGAGAETAYLSLTRGDGGQNLIGPELDEGLGAVRTGELLAARSLDGGRQFFTRAFDYGYSKNAEEAFSNWSREELLRDVVWVMRTFRPHVVVSIFTGTPADGHGQHQAAGIMAREGFRAAGDPDRFPDQLRDGAEAWAPRKLYQLAWRDPESATTSVATGDFDPLLGRSWYQVAMESRSQHRSQDMGAPRPLGARTSRLGLVESRVDAAPGEGLFAGVDTALADLAESLPGHARGFALDHLRSYREALRAAEGALGALDPSPAVPHLARALDHLAAVAPAARDAGPAGRSLLRVVERKSDLAGSALLAAAGVVVRAEVDDPLVVPGESAEVTVEAWNGGPFPVESAVASLDLPPGWSAEPLADPAPGAGRFTRSATPGRPPHEVAAGGRLAPGELARWRFRVTVAPDAEPSRLYYLERPRDGEMYRWPADRSLWALPRDEPPVHADVSAAVVVPLDGSLPVRVGARRVVGYVGVDKAEGEFTEPLLVVPAVGVAVSPDALVWPLDLDEERTLTVRIRSFAEAGASGTLEVRAPEGWRVEPARVPFALEGPGQERSVSVTVTPAGGVSEGLHRIRAVARTADGGAYDRSVRLLDYPHIERLALFDPAEVRVTGVPVRVAEGLRVGYVMGSGDDGYEAVRQLGVDVELLGPDAVRAGDFDGFDVVVLGVRAYETRPDLAAANDRLLDFARRGGTVVVQYNKYEFPRGGYAPFPVDMSRPHDRVTDQTAEVRLLDPSSPVFTRPNRIDASDWEGWVSERGLYFLGEWDERYTPLLEMADPGEAPKRGALVVTPLGEGLWVYTGLSFFRQFPAGVPGAYRLFANLISLGAEEWSRHAAGGAPGR